MFHLFKIISIIALLDYIIYSYYRKHYSVELNYDSYKYRIIICFIFWFILAFCISYNMFLLENKYNYFIYINIITLLLYISINLYNKYNYKNYSIQFMCSDIVCGIIIANILVLISFSIN